MASFQYTAMMSSGVKTKGVCESPDLQSAAVSLRTAHLLILELREIVGKPRNTPASTAIGWRALTAYWRPLTSQHLVQFFRQIGLMLRSGLPLLQALAVYQTNASHPRLASLVARISDRIQGGASLSASLATERRILPPLVARMVAAGEATGELDTLLDRIADQIEYRADLRQGLFSSLTYPALVIMITIGVVVFLVSSVIPKFVHMLSVRNIALPASTQLLIDITNFLNDNGIKILAGIFAAIVLFAIVYFTRQGRFWIHRTFLAIPVIGNVLTLAFLAHFGRTLAILLKSGIPALDGLAMLSESVGNQVFARHLKRAELELLGGKALSKSLCVREIPAILPELVGIGEATGTLDTVLEEFGVFHEKKLQRNLKWLATLFEPAMILIVGGIVGFVYISFFQVLYQMAAKG